MENISNNISSNLQSLRQERGLSLDKTSEITGVSKGMLAQIERGDSVPTITTVWKIATGFKVSFSSLIYDQKGEVQVVRKDEGVLITENDQNYRVRNIVPFSPERHFEVFSVELTEGETHVAEPHGPEVEEHIFVNSGTLEMVIDEQSIMLNRDDAVIFDGNQPHIYKNAGEGTVQFKDILFYKK
ncbi:DNA-binding protein [Salinicoccus sediminis]|uniref:DNA-binding protein n=1 Tax=Salinicoccus sediminis TaxID=1432562 RepID=A0A0M2SLX7_9STAP|nr:XRE family transcriptional regulator [Salinicoccus sediminis]KKK34666.1 DNA-binding protein [Salinicoccus sediminis]